MTGKIESILIKHPKDAFVSQENLNNTWEEYKFFGCPDYEKVLEEYAVFEKILKDHIPNIYYLPYNENTGLDSIYAHDPLKVTKSGAIYFPMGKAVRGKEYLATRAYLESIGIPTLGVITAPGKIEGGDVLWLDEKTVAIGRGYRTNDEGIRQFKELTKDFIDEYIIIPMPHGEGEDCCLHLMSVISLVNTKAAAVYSKYMPVFFRQYLLENGYTLIECNDEEYDYLGTNLLALEPGKCILIKGCPDIQQKLETAGITIYNYEGREMSYRGTGGPTCLTCPLTRQ